MSETETGLPGHLPLGKVYTSRGRTIPDGECTMLTDLTWTTMGIHVDEPYAETGRFGGLVLAAPVMVPIISGLWVMGDHNRHLREKHGVRVSTALGCEARYRSPFRFGDTIWVDHQLADVRPSRSNPGMGVATMVDRAYNQRGETVTEMKRFQLVQPVERS